MISNNTVFPISLRVTVELAMIMDRLYGGVCYAGIDTDPELKYPKVNLLLLITTKLFLLQQRARENEPSSFI